MTSQGLSLTQIMTQSKTKTCQNCKSKFTIEPEDFEFYKKIDVPEPTFCPDCRMQRRIGSRNNRKLYKRKCDFSGKEIVSVFHSDSPHKVYEQKIWWSDKWDPLEYGKDYNFNRPFFEQFYELSKVVPWINLRVINSVGCDYCNGMVNGKNCYMSTGYEAEDCLYMDGAGMAKESVDSSIIVRCERMYEDINCNSSYNIVYCKYCDNCIDSAFLYDCRNCQNCFACVSLRNKKYHIFNRPYTKTDYQNKIKKYDIGSYHTLLKIKEQFDKYSLKFPKPWARISKSVDATGNDIRFAKNCHNCFNVFEGAENCKFIYVAGLALKDSYDIIAGGAKSELMYESDFVMEGRNIICSGSLSNCYNINYAMESYSSSDLFGCIGLRHKQHCILNKQYTKEQYEEMIPRIKKHMNDMPYIDRKGRIYKYGEFFPLELSRFAYNETTNRCHYPLTKKQALDKGYLWRDKDKLDYKPTIKAKDLPDNIKDVDGSILKEIIECQNAGSDCAGSDVFRIIPEELKFYKKMNIPLPRFCPDCRYYKRIRPNQLKLHTRQCMNKGCNTKFQTTYAPDREEIVYCESCYNKEVG